jgi:predicted lysophospholipase L1 biosynthesis ABC-type transport system permease subunit
VLPGLGTYPGSDKTALGEGAVVTREALAALGADFDREAFLVQFRAGAPRENVIDRARELASATGDSQDFEVSGVQRPSDIVAYERVRTLPLLLAGLLALLTTATVAHALVTAVRRRRRDLALFKTLGFSRRQTSGAVAWQATTVGVVALVCGVPLGIVGGRWGWQVLTDNLGTVSEPIVPRLALLVAVPLVGVILNLVAFVPGRIAAHLRPATVLRSE